MSAFDSASPEGRIDLAKLWCWRYQEETKGLSVLHKFIKVRPHYQLMRELRPYVPLDYLTDDSPYCVLAEAVRDSKLSKLTAEHRETFITLAELVWLGEPEERHKAVQKFGSLIGKCAKKDKLPDDELLIFAQDIAWDAMRAVESERVLSLVGAARISICCGRANIGVDYAHQDERAIAWHALSLCAISRRSKIFDSRNVDVLSTIRAQPVISAVDGIVTIIESLKKFSVTKGTVFAGANYLTSHQASYGTVWDALRHWVPARSNLWNTAEALELQLGEATQKVYAELSTPQSEPVELPADFTS